MANISNKELYDIIKRIAKSQEDTSKLYEYLLSSGITKEEIKELVSSSFISVEPQEFTEEQQMQARANQGLYNKRLELTNVLEWDGDITGKYNVEGFPFYKIGEPIDKDLLIGVKVYFISATYGTISMIDELHEYMPGVYAHIYENTPMIAIVPEDVEIYGFSWKKGLYLCKLSESQYTCKLESITSRFNKEVIDLVEPKYIEDLYYKENTLPESIQWDGNIEDKELFPVDELHTLPLMYFYKISDKILYKDDLLGGTIIVDTPSREIFNKYNIYDGAFKRITYEYEGEDLELPNAYLLEYDYIYTAIIVYDTIDVPALSSPISPGVYFIANFGSQGEVYSFTKELKILPKYQYHQIPQEYIPKVPIITIAPQTYKPDVFYNLGTITTDPNFTFEQVSDNNYHEYMIQFAIGSTVPSTITFPINIKFNQEIEWEADTIYEISIVNNRATVQSWDNS